jgi:hypothetical protein
MIRRSDTGSFRFASDSSWPGAPCRRSKPCGCHTLHSRRSRHQHYQHVLTPGHDDPACAESQRNPPNSCHQPATSRSFPKKSAGFRILPNEALFPLTSTNVNDQLVLQLVIFFVLPCAHEDSCGFLRTSTFPVRTENALNSLSPGHFSLRDRSRKHARSLQRP